MARQVICPICHNVNETEERTVGCYVQCRHCPQRFYVEAPTLDGQMPLQAVPCGVNVVPGYRSFERLLHPNDQETHGLMILLKRQHRLLSWMLLFQGATILIGLMLVFLLSSQRT